MGVLYWYVYTQLCRPPPPPACSSPSPYFLFVVVLLLLASFHSALCVRLVAADEHDDTAQLAAQILALDVVGVFDLTPLVGLPGYFDAAGGGGFFDSETGRSRGGGSGGGSSRGGGDGW